MIAKYFIGLAIICVAILLFNFATEFRYIDGSIVGGVVAIFTYSMFSIIVIGADAVRHTNDR